MVLKLNSIFVLSGSTGLRYEELPGEWFDYNNAFPTVTSFYSVPAAHHTLTETATNGEPSSPDMDTTKMAEGKISIILKCYDNM